MGLWQDLFGTSNPFFRIGLTGIRLISSSGLLRVTNAAGTTDAPVQTSRLDVSGETIVLNSDATGTGADRTFTLARPTTGMSGNVTLTLPPSAGSPGQVLSTDGSGNTSWTANPGGADKLTTDVTTLAFGSTSPLSLFTLPSGATILSVQVIIDTAFNGTPSLSIGITGQTSKYLSSTQVDLTAAATTVFEVYPGQPAPGSSESLIATYAAGGATAGSARIIISYATPS